MKHLRVVGQNSSLDPARIEDLATAMAEEMLVDMRVVPGGIAERVQIIGLLIRRDSEEVQIRQVLTDGTENVQWVDSEGIWWVRPTSFGYHDELREFSPDKPTGRLESGDSAYDSSVKAVAFYHRLTVPEVHAAAQAGLDGNHFRYWIMLLWEELTGQGAREATKLFNYGSIQPFVSARALAKRDMKKYEALRALVKLRQAP